MVLAERPELAETAETEEELRQAVRLSAQGGYGFSYLRFVREPQEGDEDGAPTGAWRPAAGTYEGWPRKAKDLKVLDPCCGSGHFLVEGLELLVRLRMQEEGLGLGDAIRGVLSDNLHGLELDPRCTQIAAFNLAVAAWKLAGQPIELPELHIACSGLGPNATKEEWLELAEGAAAAGGMPVDRDLFREQGTLLSTRIRGGLAALYDLFLQAPELGSLSDPGNLVQNGGTPDMYVADFAELQPLLEHTKAADRTSAGQLERTVAAQGMAKAAELLAGEYALVITNVPYLARAKQAEELRESAEREFPAAKADLATMFVLRAMAWLGKTGTAAVVTPQNWLFLTSYRRLRERLLGERTWNAVARLGSNAFRDMNFWAATTALVAISAGRPSGRARFFGLDASQSKEREYKRRALRGAVACQAGCHRQVDQLANPDTRILLQEPSGLPLVGTIADYGKGSSTGDAARLLVQFWELPVLGPDRLKWLNSTRSGAPWSGRSLVTTGLIDSAPFQEQIGCRVHGQRVWGHPGIAFQLMNQLPHFAYDGEMFDNNCGVLAPTSQEDLPALWSWCDSGAFREAVRSMDQKVNVAPATLGKVPIDAAHWRDVAREKYPNGLPEPHSDDPTQWLFHGHPAKAEPHTVLQVAVARLLGYRWPPELDSEMRLAHEARTWVQRCEDLASHADPDGIICLNATRGESPAADRLRQLLAAAFGSDWSGAMERQLLTAAAGDAKPAGSLEDWLRDSFFTEHCKLFHHRPFIWHIWDGRKDGFHALVNYHRLAGPDGEGHRTLQALTYSYLGDWVERQKADQREGKEGADGRLAAAQDLQAQLEKILEGGPPYDLFVRWKALHEQPIGWEPDINDGVRLNIRPFMSVELRTGGRKGAGILRWKPNTKWKKDRGKEPESLRPREEYPWFWSCPGDETLEERTDFKGSTDFDGNRWNDLHYTVACKQDARTAQTESGSDSTPTVEKVDGV